ncbi:MAG TPA: hypothetical protein VMF30_11380 [Pirellulales bacterium]|nr:hypothetical protein [Pirellulales bacterium]
MISHLHELVWKKLQIERPRWLRAGTLPEFQFVWTKELRSATSTQRFGQSVQNRVADVMPQVFAAPPYHRPDGDGFSAMRSDEHRQPQTGNQPGAESHQHRLRRPVVNGFFRPSVMMPRMLGCIAGGLPGCFQPLMDGLMRAFQRFVNTMLHAAGRLRGLGGSLIDEMLDRFPRFTGSPLDATDQLFDTTIDMK